MDIKVGSIIKAINVGERRVLHLIGRVESVDGNLLVLSPVVVKLFIEGVPIIGYNPYNSKLHVDTEIDDVSLVNTEDYEDFMDSLLERVVSDAYLSKIVDDHFFGAGTESV